MGQPRTSGRVLITVVVLAALLAVGVHGRRMASRVRIGMDGGYSDILVQVSEDLPRQSCRNIISGLKVERTSA